MSHWNSRGMHVAASGTYHMRGTPAAQMQWVLAAPPADGPLPGTVEANWRATLTTLANVGLAPRETWTGMVEAVPRLATCACYFAFLCLAFRGSGEGGVDDAVASMRDAARHAMGAARLADAAAWGATPERPGSAFAFAPRARCDGIPAVADMLFWFSDCSTSPWFRSAYRRFVAIMAARDALLMLRAACLARRGAPRARSRRRWSSVQWTCATAPLWVFVHVWRLQ